MSKTSNRARLNNRFPVEPTNRTRVMSPRRRPGRSTSGLRSGAALILILLMIPLIVAMVAFSIDLGLQTALRSQMQNSVDAGALAASLRIQQNSEELTEAAAAAEEFIQRNRVGSGITVPSDAIAVEIGKWDADLRTFTVTSTDPNAVRVIARQDNERFLFGRFFGRETFGAGASAIATGSPSPFDIMMVLDLSGSMSSQGRIEALQNAAPAFVDVIEDFGDDDKIGVMGLSADPGDDEVSDDVKSKLYSSGLHPSDGYHVGVLEARLTDNYGQLRGSVLSPGNLQANKYAKPKRPGYTGTGAAIGDAAHYLKYGAEARPEGEAKRIIVLMSDGKANRPRRSGSSYAKEMANYADGLDVTIYTISLGDGADLKLMQEIADRTGGTHFDATGSGEATLTARLIEAFRKAASEIKRTHLVQ